MTKLLSFIIFCFLLNSLSAQTSNSRIKLDTTKYRINLPEYWKPGSKVWQILDEKLPEVAEELKGKQLCGDDCKPKYSIEFEMSEPVVVDYFMNHVVTGATTDTWEIQTLYSFSSALYLFEDKDRVLTKFILVDTNEIWRVKNRVELQLPSRKTQPMRIYALRPPYSTGNSAADWVRTQEPMGSAASRGSISPYNYINNNKDKLNPTQRDMLNVIDEKFRSW